MSQKKVKFNIVDIIVILVLLAGIAFVGVRMFGDQQPSALTDSTDRNTHTITFYAECVPEIVAETLEVGCKVENESRNMDLNVLKDFVIGESVWYTADSKGNAVQTSKPGYVSVRLVCEVTGTETPTGLQIGQYTLNAGHEMDVCCGMAEFPVIVYSISSITTE